MTVVDPPSAERDADALMGAAGELPDGTDPTADAQDADAQDADAQDADAQDAGGASRTARRFTVVEVVLGSLVVLVSAAYLARFISAMATTSLWTDEVFTVRNFASSGPFNAVTNYRTANNHVLQSLLTSLLPFDPYNPLRARVWSMVLMVAMLVGLAVHFFSRRQFLVGGLVVYLLALNEDLVDLDLQTRGYGPLAAAAALTMWSLLRYLEEGARKHAIILAVSIVLGAWALPSYLFFAGPLLVLLIVRQRNKASLAIAGGAGVAVLVVYAPILGDLIKATRNYAEEFGGDHYTSLSNVVDTFRTFLFQPTAFRSFGLVAAVALAVLVVAVLVKVTLPPGHRDFALLVFGATIAFFIVCLLLRTPILRTTAFIVVPVVFASATVIGDALQRVDRRIAIGLAAVLTSAAVTSGVIATRQFRYLPSENWMDSAKVIGALAPDGVPVYVTRSGEHLTAYLTPSIPVLPKLDEAAFGRGEVIVLDGARDRPAAKLIEDKPFAVFKVPQQRVPGSQWVIVPRPERTGVERVLLGATDITEAITDGDPTEEIVSTSAMKPETTMLDIALDDGQPARALVLMADRFPTTDFVVKVTGPDGERTLTDDDIIQFPGAVALVLGDRKVERLTVSSPVRLPSKAISLREAWVLPTTVG